MTFRLLALGAAFVCATGCASVRAATFAPAPFDAVAVESESNAERCVRQKCTPPTTATPHHTGAVALSQRAPAVPIAHATLGPLASRAAR